MKAEEIINLIDRYWKFDDNQQHASNWHDKQDLLELLRKSTPQPHPTMSADKYMIDFSWWLVKNIGKFSDDMQAHYNGEYLNIWRKSESLELNAIASFTPPRNEQEEADRLVSIYERYLTKGNAINSAISDQENTITALQLRGLSTEFEEKVLTILKGM